MAAKFYGPNLARVHHEDFGAFARAAALTLVELLGIRDANEGPVVDLGSGSGIMAKELTERGYAVHGFDVSSEMVKLARSIAPKAKFSQGSAHRAKLPRCVAVTAIGEVLGYQNPKDKKPPSLANTFRQIFTALRPGGVFLFDLAGPGRSRGGYERFVETERWSMHLAVREEELHLQRRITLFAKKNKATYERTQETHELVLAKPLDVLENLRGAGFKARAIRGYANLELPNGWSAFVARKV